jgi:hypothetical protein
MEGTGRDDTHTSLALKLCFQHHIQKDINQWNACYKHICCENQSGLNNVASITKKTEDLHRDDIKKPFWLAGGVEFLHQMSKFQLMGKVDIDDESDYAPAMDDKPPDNELDAYLMMVLMATRNYHQNHH